MITAVNSRVPLNRKERAARTRSNVLRAADLEFAANGYQGTTMAAIAQRAGVAVQTVYFVFHTKAQLISDLVGAAVLGVESPTPPQESEWYRAAVAAPDGTAAVAAFVRGSAEIYRRASSAVETLRIAAPTDGDVRAAYETAEGLRIQSVSEFLSIVVDKTTLAPGLAFDDARDVMATLYGPRNYIAFVRDLGWGHDRYIEWVAGALPRLLFG